MNKKRRKSSGDEGEIDLTPMLDVVFIMLIFFIVTATFIKEPGVDVNRADAATYEAIEKQGILVAITNNNEVFIDKKKVEPRDLRIAIERLVAENPKGSLVIQADEESTAERYGEVYDAARAANAFSIHLASDKVD